MRATLCALTLVLVCASACDRTAENSGATAATIEKASTVDPMLLQKIVDAPTTVSWRGRRRFEANYTFRGTPVHLVYEETLTTDGTGQFELKADDLITPVLSTNEETLFLLTQDNREGLMFRHRDPTVRDVDYFTKNYTAVDAGFVEQVVGRDCARWTVRHKAGGHTWTIWIDLATGVILKSEERDESQALVSLVEYLDFDDAPDTTNAVWHTSVLQEAPLDPNQAQLQLGFEPVTPKLLPATYRLLRSEHVVEPVTNRNWARFVYTDGWCEVVFMDGGAMTGPQQTQGIAPDADVLRYLEVGPWSIADGRVASRRVLVAVRGNEGLLKLLVETSLQ